MSFLSRIGIGRSPSTSGTPMKPKADMGSGGFGWRFLEAADWYGNASSIWDGPPRDFDKDVQPFDYQVVVQASRRLYANSGIAHIIDDKAMYSVGRAWFPKFRGKDRVWGKKAENWLKEKYYPMCDVRGPNFDFRKNIYLDSINMDVSGDFGVLMVKTADGWPQTQRIPSHRISSGDASENQPLKEGKYTGLKISQGVIYNPNGRPVAYRVRTDTGFQDVPASSFIHVFDPSWYDQGRGLPASTHALNDLKSLKKTQGFEQMAMEILSSIGITEENPEGAPDPTDPSMLLRPASSPGNPALVSGKGDGKNKGLITAKSLFGGMWKFFKSGTGSKLSTLQHGRPGPNWESFWNRIIKGFCVGLSWPYELAWALNSLGGAALRAAVSKANRAVQDRQEVLKPGALREIQFAISCAIAIGELEDSDEWYLWEFSMPPSMTVDIGREAQQQREDYRMKIMTLRDIVSPLGGSTEDHYRQLGAEFLERAAIAAELQVPIEALSIPDIPKSTGYTVTEKVQ